MLHKEGKVKVSFNGRLTWSHITKQLDLMNTGDFVNYQYDRAAANGTRSSWAKSFRGNFGNPLDNDKYYAQPTNNWQDEVMGNTPLSYQANVNIGGGNETTKFNLSINQSEDKGIILGSGVRRTILNLKLNTKLHKNLEFNYNPKMTYRRDEGAGGDNVGTGGIIDVLRYRPTAGLRSWGSYHEAEDADEAANFTLTNPVNAVSNQFSLKWTPIKGLVLRTEGNYNISFRDNNRFYGYLTTVGQKSYNKGQPVATITKRTAQSYTWTNTASYDMSIKDDHNLSFLLGQEIYNSWYEESAQTNNLFSREISADQAFNNMSLGTP